MSKFKKTFCALCLSVLAFIGQGNADEHFPFLGEISRGPVNARAGANTNFEIVDKLAKGTEVVVLGRSYEWYKIQLPATAGAFIRGDYIKVHDGNTGELIGTNVNVRAKANSESSPLGQLRKGDVIKLLEKSSDWWKIAPAVGTFAWLHADFVTLKSAQISDGLMPKPLTLGPDVSGPSLDAVKVEPIAAVPLAVTVQGKLQAVPSAQGNVRYQILVDGKPVYFLQDAPHLDHFDRAFVHVEGMVVGNGQSSLYPVLHINKISLVL